MQKKSENRRGGRELVDEELLGRRINGKSVEHYYKTGSSMYIARESLKAAAFSYEGYEGVAPHTSQIKKVCHESGIATIADLPSGIHGQLTNPPHSIELLYDIVTERVARKRRERRDAPP